MKKYVLKCFARGFVRGHSHITSTPQPELTLPTPCQQPSTFFSFSTPSPLPPSTTVNILKIFHPPYPPTINNRQHFVNFPPTLPSDRQQKKTYLFLRPTLPHSNVNISHFCIWENILLLQSFGTFNCLWSNEVGEL